MGTDIPFNRGDSHQKMAEYVAKAELSTEDFAAIYGGNALRLFGSRLG
jgi:predicted TIM-barrel fold metal-dependent hydrolase